MGIINTWIEIDASFLKRNWARLFFNYQFVIATRRPRKKKLEKISYRFSIIAYRKCRFSTIG